MPGPRPIEIKGGNIYPQATKKFYAWPTPERIYRWEHLPQAMTKFHAWPTPKRNCRQEYPPQAKKKFYAWPTPKRKYRRKRLPQNHEEIICLADADEGKRINYSLKPVTNYKLKAELKVPHRYYEQPEAGSIL